MKKYKAQFENDRVIFTDSHFNSIEAFKKYVKNVDLESKCGKLLSITPINK